MDWTGLGVDYSIIDCKLRNYHLTIVRVCAVMSKIFELKSPSEISLHLSNCERGHSIRTDIKAGIRLSVVSEMHHFCRDKT